jgi:hypothetical protein
VPAHFGKHLRHARLRMRVTSQKLNVPSVADRKLIMAAY